MRDKSTLAEIKEIGKLQEYLYFNPDNCIVVETELGSRLALSMDDDGRIIATPQVVNMEAFVYDSLLSVPVWRDILAQMKEQPAADLPDKFQSRWEEICFSLAIADTLRNRKVG